MIKILQNPEQRIFKKYDSVIEKALSHYNIESDTIVRPLNYSENIVYFVEELKSRRSYVFRIGKPDYHSETEIESELKWMRLLKRESQIEIPDIVPGVDGKYVQKLFNDNKTYYCVMFTFLTGKSLDDDLDHLPRYFEKIGEITAEFHNISSRDLNASKKIDRPIWDFETTLGSRPKWGKWQDGPGLTLQRKSLFQSVSELIDKRLDKFGQDNDHFGLIHADLRTVNLLTENQKIKVIDFDDCGFSWYLYDLAASLSFIEHLDVIPELVKLWLIGYRKHRHLSDEEEHEIPTFIMLRRLLLLGWIASHSDTETARQMSVDFSEQTEFMAQRYLSMFS